MKKLRASIAKIAQRPAATFSGFAAASFCDSWKIRSCFISMGCSSPSRWPTMPRSRYAESWGQKARTIARSSG